MRKFAIMYSLSARAVGNSRVKRGMEKIGRNGAPNVNVVGLAYNRREVAQLGAGRARYLTHAYISMKFLCFRCEYLMVNVCFLSRFRFTMLRRSGEHSNLRAMTVPTRRRGNSTTMVTMMTITTISSRVVRSFLIGTRSVHLLVKDRLVRSVLLDFCNMCFVECAILM